VENLVCLQEIRVCPGDSRGHAPCWKVEGGAAPLPGILNQTCLHQDSSHAFVTEYCPAVQPSDVTRAGELLIRLLPRTFKDDLKKGCRNEMGRADYTPEEVFCVKFYDFNGWWPDSGVSRRWSRMEGAGAEDS
jgi:hypothetical protein